MGRLIDSMSAGEVVGAVNRYQERCARGLFHAYTCGLCGEPGRSLRPLVAQLGVDGDVWLVCPSGCGWEQRLVWGAQLEAAVQMSLAPVQPWEGG